PGPAVVTEAGWWSSVARSLLGEPRGYPLVCRRWPTSRRRHPLGPTVNQREEAPCGASGAIPAGLGVGAGFEGKLATLGSAEAAGAALGGDLAEQGGVQGGLRGLAAGRGPVALGGHVADQLLAAHRHARLGQHPGRRVQRADLLRLRLGWLR